MRIMGLDVGDKTIGIAISDLMFITAQGIKTLRRTNIKQDLKNLEQTIAEYNVLKIVVGFPRNMNGSVGPQGEKIQKFAERLKRRFDMEIILWDERLTTVMAEQTLLDGGVSRAKRKKVIDMVAATYILQNYLDSQNH